MIKSDPSSPISENSRRQYHCHLQLPAAVLLTATALNAICLPIGTSAAQLRCFRRLGIAGCIRPVACSPPLLLTLLCFSRCCSDKVTKNA
ncbi:hypothetical protein L2E82_12444 [Cichorium intybus]|uniref:Uncharacterized protein n=1 Tax=Cichorium intybus TaxID=13427 RepID=A0ACB9GFU1_CICIN|nr:hypothetical protein L2E82_12444 [Cichorium intybus]